MGSACSSFPQILLMLTRTKPTQESTQGHRLLWLNPSGFCCGKIIRRAQPFHHLPPILRKAIGRSFKKPKMPPPAEESCVQCSAQCGPLGVVVADRCSSSVTSEIRTGAHQEWITCSRGFGSDAPYLSVPRLNLFSMLLPQAFLQVMFLLYCHGDEAAEDHGGADLWSCCHNLLLTPEFSCHQQV